MKQRTHQRGQAIVEFALSATLIFFLLCATIDLGLIFFAVQGMHNAAQEGGTYGSRWLETVGGKRVLNTTEIRKRVRHESGEQGGIGFVNLLDLNGDGVDDEGQSGVIDQYISVQMLSDSPDYDGNPLNNGTAPDYSPCDNAATAGPGGCYAYVTIRANHNLVFPLSPVFTDTIQLTSAFMVPIRDTLNQGDQNGPPPVVTTPGPTADPDTIVLAFVGNTSRTGQSDTKFEFTAYDSAVGTSNGNGISNLVISVTNANGTYSKGSDPSSPYCAYGNSSCSKMVNSQWNPMPSGDNVLTITAIATSTSGKTKPLTLSVTVKK